MIFFRKTGPVASFPGVPVFPVFIISVNDYLVKASPSIPGGLNSFNFSGFFLWKMTKADVPPIESRQDDPAGKRPPSPERFQEKSGNFRGKPEAGHWHRSD